MDTILNYQLCLVRPIAMAGVLYIDTSFTKITVKPVHPTFGAEIQVSDWNNLDDDAVREISSAANKVKRTAA